MSRSCFASEGAPDSKKATYLLHGEGIILRHELHWAGEIRGVWPLSFHVPLQALLLSLALKRDRQFVLATWELGLAEVAQFIFKLQEIIEHLLPRNFGGVVV